MKKIVFGLLGFIFFLGHAVNGFADDEATEVNLEALRTENIWLKEQVHSLKALLEKKEKSFIALSNRVSILHEELITQNQIEDQLLKDLAFIADQMQPEEYSVFENVAIEPEANIVESSSYAQNTISAENSAEKNIQPVAAQKNPVVLQDKAEITPLQNSFAPRSDFIAATFKLIDDVTLVDENNQAQMSWIKGKSFTARELYGDFYKVSGYFVDSKWKSAQKKLYLPANMAVRR